MGVLDKGLHQTDITLSCNISKEKSNACAFSQLQQWELPIADRQDYVLTVFVSFLPHLAAALSSLASHYTFWFHHSKAHLCLALCLLGNSQIPAAAAQPIVINVSLKHHFLKAIWTTLQKLSTRKELVLTLRTLTSPFYTLAALRTCSALSDNFIT